jgi:adenine-specific DNA-methyltransferase
MNNYNQLKEVLNDIFELNKADLDFGIYRIINQKRKQVNEFIEKQLPEDIKQALSETQTADKTEIENELKTLKKNLDDAGIVAEDSPKYKLLKERLQGIENSDVLEQEVFSHLANFFRRYYKDGDFISMRRYKKDVYAIPYEGEEVKLHWANHDQYYIKSSENFKNYSFKTPDGKKVTFQLKEVTTEQNNNKTQGDAERKFAIYKDQTVEEINGELLINFIYEPFSNTVKQETLLTEALELLTDNIPSSYTTVFSLSPTEKNGKRTLLEKHLKDYVSKNSFDYFIHKDLGGFLSRELDFYIKNEVLYIDDINAKQTDFFVAQLSKVKAIKTVAEKVISFLDQIENFQKKLWLKKKFVIRTDYCITLDKVPNTYYAEILQNKSQLKEWKTLFDVDVQNAEQLVFEQFLVLDTKFFDESFKDRLLAEFDNLEEQINGLMINSENYQALNFLQNKFNESIDGIYIDPPYNTNSSEIVYKNSYKHSSWLALMQNRILLSKDMMIQKGLICMTIDDLELPYLWTLGNEIFELDNHLGTATIRINPGGRKSVRKLAFQHEYAIFYGKTLDSAISFFEKKIEDKTHKYILGEDGSYYEERNLRKEGQDSLAKEGSERFYPIYRNTITGQISTENTFDQVIYPIDTEGNKRIWRRGKEVIDDMYNNGDIFYKETKYGSQLYFKFKGGTEGEPPRSFWDDKKFSASEHGTQILNNIIGKELFSFPKSIHAVIDCLKVMSAKNNSVYLDYFSGSGTTGHATIKLNREDGGNRKYILVEMGTYFNTVTKPRIQKVIYSDNWKNGKPLDKRGISQIVKYQVLESYEDTLNNLFLQSKTELDFSGKAKEEYLLQYMLEMESREHLVNLEMFRKPFNYQLKVTENNELVTTKVDLVETFNYLIGLFVSKVQRVKDIKVIEGTTRTGVKTLVIWRDLDTTTHDEVEKLLRRFYDSQRTKDFQQIYINGDHHLENLRSEGDQFKIKLIEETFFKKMFNETEL